MDEERFNLSLRKLLKQFGVTAQREVEKAVDDAQRSGALAGRRTLKARTVMSVEGLDAEIAVEGQIDLE
jgi:hypothetical protein